MKYKTLLFILFIFTFLNKSLLAQESAFSYNPEGKEEFIFKELAERSQKLGYFGFCKTKKSPICYKNRLDYKKFLGTKGYFNTIEPVITKHKKHFFYPVTLQNGQKFYYVVPDISLFCLAKKFHFASPITPLKPAQPFKPQTLIPLSLIHI